MDRMSKTKLLRDMVDNLQELAQSITAIAEAIEGNAPGAEEIRAEETPQAPEVTLEQVRQVMAALVEEGKTSQIKELLLKYNAGRLSDVNPEDYRSLIQEASKL